MANGREERDDVIGRIMGRQKGRTPEDLTLEELLSGVDVGEFGSWYEHEIFRKVGERWRACADRGRFVRAEAAALPGFDAVATDAVYGSRGIRDAFVVNLPERSRFGCPAAALYLHPNGSDGERERWSMVRFHGYEVLPRFYEDIGVHELVGWRLADRFPLAEAGYPRAGIEDPHLDPTSGVVTFRVRPDGAGRAARFARLLRAAMEELGILCEPVVAVRGRDHDELAVEDGRPRGAGSEEHAYQVDNGTPWAPTPPPDYETYDGWMGRTWNVHRVIPAAGPGVPEQARADAMIRGLKEYAHWEALRRDLERRMEDERIPARRLAALLEQREEAAKMSEEALAGLLADGVAVAGLMLSMEDAVRTLTERAFPLMFWRPEGGKGYPPDLSALWSLQGALGGLFQGPAEEDRP